MGRSIMDHMDSGAMAEEERRILIYFLLDVSGSMCGAPLAAVQDGLEFLVRELKKTPEAIELANLCVITFGSQARLSSPLSPVTQFNTPQLVCGGSTNMTAALELVNQQIDHDFHENKGGDVRGDYKPLIFLMTDGAPDNIGTAEQAARALFNRPSGRTIGTFLALGCGAGANEGNLKRLTPAVAVMTNMSSENISLYFKWVSASIKIASKRASQSAEGQQSMQAPQIEANSSGDSPFEFTF